MTKQEKLIKIFLENPKSLKYRDIQKLFEQGNYSIDWWKWSHRKIIHKKSNKIMVIPIHNNDINPVYKRKLRDFYLNNK